MPLEKQSLNNFLPDGFETNNLEGYKENFSADKIATGYEKDVKDRVSGPNFNNLLDVLGKNTNTLNSYVEYLNNLSVNKTPIIDSNNQLNSTQIGLKVYSAAETYLLNDLVTTIQDGKVLFYKSLVASNTGNPLTNIDYWEEVKLGGSGLEICDISMALYVDETKGLRRYLNGQIVDINANTQAFLNRLLEIKNTNPDYFTTEENWQSEATLNIDGCVYKFVLNYASDGETVVSVRLPKYPDYVEINAGGTLPVVGNGTVLGLTNGTGFAGITSQVNGNFLTANKNHYGSPVSSENVTNSQLTGRLGVTTDPTKSGIQTTLKQTKLKMRYFIQIATGSETENNIINDIELNNPYSLFDSKYSDHELNNLSWLKSEGQWNAKAVYPTAYDKLLKVYNGIETVEGLSVKLSTETYTDYDFVLNTADETFRLPLKTKLASGKAVVGNGMTLGFTNGTDNFGIESVLGANAGHSMLTTGSYGKNVGTASDTSYVNASKVFGVTTDPTKSGIELSDSGLYLYYYVGETVQNANLIDAGRIGEQLATKTDMLQASGAGMPSNRYIDLTLGASGTLYTAPANGWFRLVKKTLAVGQSIQFKPQELYRGRDNSDAWMYQFSSIANQALTITLPVLKGQKTWCYYSAGGDTVVFEFIYAEGSK